MRSLILTFLISSAALLHAESRTWKSSDGTQSFTGDYVTHDAKRVTIRRADGRVFTLELTKLHEADKTWLSTKQVPGRKDAEPLPDPNAVFDTLCFGDPRADVTKKLKESKIVEAGLDETFLGRVGLNGTYRTRKQIGGLHCELYFDWSAGGNLSEVSLQTQGVDRTAYAGRLKGNCPNSRTSSPCSTASPCSTPISHPSANSRTTFSSPPTSGASKAAAQPCWAPRCKAENSLSSSASPRRGSIRSWFPEAGRVGRPRR